MEIQLIFAWYDIWIGAFWDGKKRWLYILPIPMCGIILKFPHQLSKQFCNCENQKNYRIDDDGLCVCKDCHKPQTF